MWRRKHGSRESQARQELNYDSGSLYRESKAMTDSKRGIASIRHHQVRLALLPFCVLILLLIRAECRRTPTVALTTNDILQEEQLAGKLRFDWTNMTLHSNMAKRIYAQQNNCSLPLSSGSPLLPYGLGSSLHSWGMKMCYAMGSQSRAWTSSSEPWIWLDEEKCNQKEDKSTMQCYFPSLELQCPSDVDPKDGKMEASAYTACIEQVLGNNTQQRWSELRAAATEYMFHNVSHVVIEEAERQLQLVFPGGAVPPNLITVHIRWGDKILVEMKKVPIQQYLKGVYSILEMRNASASQPVNIFLATEDPHAVQEFKNKAPSHWNIFVDQYFHDMKPHRPEKAFGQNNNVNANKTKGRAGLVALGSLLVAAEADNFVLTTRSNWSRLMNELRKNVLDPRCNGCTNMVDLQFGGDK
jgi:hypothetical protein